MAPELSDPLAREYLRRRLEGLAPFTLQRAFELEAAFLVTGTSRYVNDPAGWRVYLASKRPQELHAMIASILHHQPGRRIR